MIDTLRELWWTVRKQAGASKVVQPAFRALEAAGFGPGTSTAADEILHLREVLRIDGDQHASAIREARQDQQGRVDAYAAEIERLRAALADTFAMMDEGWLVRDTKNDAAPDWAIKQLGFVSRLARNHAALAGPAEEDRG